MIYLCDMKKGLYLYLLCCLMITAYILVIYVVSYNLMQERAKGSLIYDPEGNIRGSILLAQNFTSDQYFKGRKNFSIDDNICDVAMYSKMFRNTINDNYQKQNNKSDSIMITQSNSRLDPYISKDEALRQAINVAAARGINPDELLQLIDQLTLHSSYPFFQLDIVNVTKLNSQMFYK